MTDLTVHNDVTPDLIALEPGDAVDVTRDDGRVERREVKWAPWRDSSGTWVLGLAGISGYYALCRCRVAAKWRGR